MDQIQIALVAIALVLSAVFLPMAFFGGSTGVIYRQFSVTIVSAMVLSVLVALILSPALTATVLKRKQDMPAPGSGWFARRVPFLGRWTRTGMAKFNQGFEWTVERYTSTISYVVDRKWIFLLIYLLSCAVLVLMFYRLPTGFLPTEDQGAASVQFRLPAGATQARTQEVQLAVEKYLREQEGRNVRTIFTVTGGGGAAAPAARIPARAS